MSLIKCPECGAMISDKAPACPHCGYPTASGGHPQETSATEAGTTTSAGQDNAPAAAANPPEAGRLAAPASQIRKPDNLPKKKHRGRKWVIAIVLILVIAGLGAGAYLKFFTDDGRNRLCRLTPEFIAAVRAYDELGVFSEGLAAVRKGELWGYIDTEGKEVIPPRFEKAEIFSEGLAAVRKGKRWGYVDRKGHETIACRYGYAMPFSEQMAAVVKNGKWGYVDRKGHEVIPCRYVTDIDNTENDVSTEPAPTPFHEGLAAVHDGNGKWGYINKKGETEIPLKIEALCAGRFAEGLACILTNESGYNIIDRTGRIVFKSGHGDLIGNETPESESLPYYRNSKIFFVANFDEIPHGMDSDDGNNVYVSFDHRGKKGAFLRQYLPYEVFIKDNHQGVADSTGKACIPPQYSSVEIHYNQDMQPSNGVVLVTLVQYATGDDADGKTYYGYADLNGHDTFTAGIKKACKDSEEAADREFKAMVKRQQEGPGWLQGAWSMPAYSDDGTPIGNIISVFDHGQCTVYAGEKLMFEYQYNVDNDILSFDKGGHYRLDESRQIVIGANGQEMQKISDDPTYTPDAATGNSMDSEPTASTSGTARSYTRFATAYDVIAYLSDKTFYNGNRRLRIRSNGVWLNDYCATGAPVVERFEAWKALIRANIPTGGRLSFLVDPTHNTVIDEAGDAFTLR